VLARVTALETRCQQLEDENSELREANGRLRKENVGLLSKNKRLREEYDQLQGRVLELEDKLLVAAKDSRNSTKPPSSDAPHNTRHYPSRVSSGLLPGGQPGHVGHGREWTNIPDAVEQHSPTACSSCKAVLDGTGSKISERRQVIDVEVTTIVTEHQLMVISCKKCHTKNRGNYPTSVTGNICFGPSVKAAMLALSAAGKLPSRVAAHLAESMFGVSISAGVLDNWRAQLAHGLDQWDEAVVEALKEAPAVGADESPIAVDGMKGAHAHVATTDRLTRFHLAGRSKKDIISGGVLKDHPGRLVTDCLPTYWNIGAAAHQACVMHLIKELRFFDECHTPSKTDTPHPHPGFANIVELLQEAVHSRNLAHGSNHPPGVGDYVDRLQLLVTQTVSSFSDAELRTATNRRARSLMNRLLRLANAGELFAFLEDLAVPPTNNSSEQALRPWKVRQRRSGCFRSQTAAREWLRIAGYLDTSRKGGVDPIEALRLAVIGQPVIP